MSRFPICLAALIFSVTVSSTEPVRAQLSRYRSGRPTLSPYFDLYRRESGPLGPYLSDFRPRQELRRAIQQQAAGLQQQDATIRSLDQRLSLSGGPADMVRPTGTGSVFMNYSHYYPGRSGSAGSRRSSSPSAARSGRGYSSY